MPDEKDQPNLDNSTTRYRALRDGTGYNKGDVFAPKVGRIYSDSKYGNLSISNFYCRYRDSRSIFTDTTLENSPDFERIEKLWEPDGIDEAFYVIEEGEIFTYRTTPTAGYPFYFRTHGNAQSCLNEGRELIEKRSRESRRL